MQVCNTPAIILKRIAYGDNDLIVTLFTPEAGRLTVIAKSARRSKKRFPGVLELFNSLKVVYTQSLRSNLPALKEAVLDDAFIHIRSDIIKTGYASYWVELINFWLPEGKAQMKLYLLLKEVLLALDQNHIPAKFLTIYYQMKFLKFAGLTPNLDTCCLCQVQTEGLHRNRVAVSLKDGGVICCDCRPSTSASIKFFLSKGTLKQLTWISQRDLLTAARSRFSVTSLKEALDFLESFVPYHVGRVPKSLTFLKSLRARDSASEA